MRKRGIMISGGMLRSGSTWLYNVVRLMLKEKDFGCGWVEELEKFKEREIVLVKMHVFSDLVRIADYVVYSFRDVRDVVASANRIFKIDHTIEGVKRIIEDDIKWRSTANFVMKYEDMMKDPLEIAKKISINMNIECDCEKILNEVNGMNYNSSNNVSEKFGHNLDNMLHEGHITNGYWGTWRGSELIDKIEIECRDWLVENGYL